MNEAEVGFKIFNIYLITYNNDVFGTTYEY